jgi:hypothetical protein
MSEEEKIKGYGDDNDVFQLYSFLKRDAEWLTV